mgnify:FL=1
MKYIIRHYLNVDVTAEVIVDESEIDINLNDLKEHKKPNSKCKFNVIKGNEKLIRTTYEKYDEKLNNSTKDGTSNK